jgi:hypothetical protein
LNGSNGAGATLTATTNGAIPLIDNVQLILNDRVLVNQQANSFENGIYVVTQVGDASNPFILTRAVDADTAPEINAGIEVRIQEGIQWGTAILKSYPSAPPITIGTTPIKFYGPPRPQVSFADVMMGSTRDRKQIAHDFSELTTTAITTNNTKLPGGTGGFVVYLTGTAAQVVQNESVEPVVDGVCELSTGTDTTGRIAISGQLAPTITNWDATKRYRYFCRCKIPVLTVNSTNMFTVRFGFLDASSSAPTAGLYFELPPDASTVKAVAMHASTATTVDTTFAQNTSFRSYTINYDENTGHALFYLSTPNPILVADINTNLPVGDVRPAPCVWILKSLGTTPGTARVDYMSAFYPDNRLPATLSNL